MRKGRTTPLENAFPLGSVGGNVGGRRVAAQRVPGERPGAPVARSPRRNPRSEGPLPDAGERRVRRPAALRNRRIAQTRLEILHLYRGGRVPAHGLLW